MHLFDFFGVTRIINDIHSAFISGIFGLGLPWVFGFWRNRGGPV